MAVTVDNSSRPVTIAGRPTAAKQRKAARQVANRGWTSTGGGAYSGVKANYSTVGANAPSTQVTAGMNLTKLAQAMGTTVDAIMRANPQITNPNMIRIGDTIKNPVVQAKLAADAARAAAAARTKKLADQARTLDLKKKQQAAQRTLDLKKKQTAAAALNTKKKATATPLSPTQMYQKAGIGAAEANAKFRALTARNRKNKAIAAFKNLPVAGRNAVAPSSSGSSGSRSSGPVAGRSVGGSTTPSAPVVGKEAVAPKAPAPIVSKPAPAPAPVSNPGVVTPNVSRFTNRGRGGTFGRFQRERRNRGPLTGLSVTPEMLRRWSQQVIGSR